jgi:hypothetical protein
MDPKGAKQRKDANRPMIELDELNQYCNQVINDLRANKRGIKVSPKGNGANDKTPCSGRGRSATPNTGATRTRRTRRSPRT